MALLLTIISELNSQFTQYNKLKILTDLSYSFCVFFFGKLLRNSLKVDFMMLFIFFFPSFSFCSQTSTVETTSSLKKYLQNAKKYATKLFSNITLFKFNFTLCAFYIFISFSFAFHTYIYTSHITNLLQLGKMYSVLCYFVDITTISS